MTLAEQLESVPETINSLVAKGVVEGKTVEEVLRGAACFYLGLSIVLFDGLSPLEKLQYQQELILLRDQMEKKGE